MKTNGVGKGQASVLPENSKNALKQPIQLKATDSVDKSAKPNGPKASPVGAPQAGAGAAPKPPPPASFNAHARYGWGDLAGNIAGCGIAGLMGWGIISLGAMCPPAGLAGAGYWALTVWGGATLFCAPAGAIQFGFNWFAALNADAKKVADWLRNEGIITVDCDCVILKRVTFERLKPMQVKFWWVTDAQLTQLCSALNTQRSTKLGEVSDIINAMVRETAEERF